MAQMSDRYQQLLDVTMAYLDELKACGVKFVPVSPETLAALAAPPPRQTRSVSVSEVLFPRSGEAAEAGRVRIGRSRFSRRRKSRPRGEGSGDGRSAVARQRVPKMSAPRRFAK